MPLLPGIDADEIAARTPPDRDRYADLLRFVAILLVVFGHWLVAVVFVEDGTILRSTELIAIVPETRPLTWIFQVMPLFFLVGGAVNIGSWRRSQERGEPWAAWMRRRARRLLVPLVPVLVMWVVLALGLPVLGLPEALTGRAARTALIPVWFLAVYLALITLVPVTTWLHDRFGIGVIVVAAGLAALVDVLHRAEVPAVGFANYALVWGSSHQLGYLWADGALPDRPRRALALGAAGAAVMALLVALPQYSLAMVQSSGDDGNTAPPTVALLAFAIAQLGVVLALKRPLTTWLERPEAWATVVVGGQLTMTLFLWHMTALVGMVAATHPTGLWPDATAIDATWWALRPVWLLLCGVVLAVLVLLFRRFERTEDPKPDASSLRTAFGLAATVVGIAIVMSVGIYRAERSTGVPVVPLVVLFAGLATLGVLRPGRSITRDRSG